MLPKKITKQFFIVLNVAYSIRDVTLSLSKSFFIRILNKKPPFERAVLTLICFRIIILFSLSSCQNNIGKIIPSVINDRQNILIKNILLHVG
jgi:hypothetical protein